jgi:hypothetical protein
VRPRPSFVGVAGQRSAWALPMRGPSTRMMMPTTRGHPSMASTTANDPRTLPELTRARRAIVVVGRAHGSLKR